MTDNQDISKNAPLDIERENQVEKSSAPASENNALDYSKLTHSNWLFINAFLQTSDVRKAYKLARYSGSEPSAPYQIFKKLKPYIEQLSDLDITSRARLQADLKSVLDIPLEERKSLTLKEWLEVRKFTAKLTPEATQQKPNISVLVINRPAKGTMEPLKGTSSPSDSAENIIDVDPIP